MANPEKIVIITGRPIGDLTHARLMALVEEANQSKSGHVHVARPDDSGASFQLCPCDDIETPHGVFFGPCGLPAGDLVTSMQVARRILGRAYGKALISEDERERLLQAVKDAGVPETT